MVIGCIDENEGACHVDTSAQVLDVARVDLVDATVKAGVVPWPDADYAGFCASALPCAMCSGQIEDSAYMK